MQDSAQGYVNPQGQMQGSFVAPQGGSSRTRRTDIQLIQSGPQPAVIAGVVDLGSHMESYLGNAPKEMRKIFLWFEYPQLKQRFYEEDETFKSSTIMLECALAVNDKAKLRKVIEAVCGRGLSDQEAYSFDITKILGARILTNVNHKQKKDGGYKEEITAFMPLGAYPLPVPFDPEMEYLSFFVDPQMQNFKTLNYAKLPQFLRKKLVDSKEGKQYVANGGLFAQMPKDNQQQGQTAPAPQAQAVLTPIQGNIIMLVNDYTYEQYKNSGWTDEALVQYGKAKYNTPTPAPAPAPSPVPAPAPVPQAPIPAPVPSTPIPQTNNVYENMGMQQQPGFVAPENGGNFLDDDDDLPF